jgi:uncharacterized membrane protein YdfJ with MMPL/SSD domain
MNPSGPVQLYVTPPEDERFKLVPAHLGESLPAVAVGGRLTVIAALPDTVPEQFASLTADNVYVLVEAGETLIVNGLLVIPVMVTGVTPSV